ncbi:MAG: tRNA epoxyqueuosine(34) reductase QueG [Devosiaceae bacterium]|nr:tRNA epoxyqueuosine(34) reductase QueG [Devosiaceae bacterium]
MSTEHKNTSPEKLAKILRVRAQKLGFDAFGIVGSDARPDLKQKLETSLQNNWHAEMEWMEKTKARRSSPKILWPEVRSIISLGMNYGPKSDPIADLKQKKHANISVYARNRDYHDLIKGRLKELAGILARHGGAQVKVFVDTAPVMEKPLAQSAGIGWQGKNTILTSRKFGSWLFLGAIFTDAQLPLDQEHTENCGSCTACLDVCPTNAFPAPFRLDARKCLAYYNNEHKGAIPIEFRKPMGNRVFGCDDCLAVCPWNKFAKFAKESKLTSKEELQLPDLADMLVLNDESFRKYFAGSPVKRLGHARFLRNVLIAAGNSNASDLLPLVIATLKHPEAIVRGAAVWAIRQLAMDEKVAQLSAQFKKEERNDQVLSEWE